MTVRIYVMPIVETPWNGIIYRCPKYIGMFAHGMQITIAASGLEDLPASMMDYGFQKVCIYVADVTSAQHTILSSKSDVLAAPVNIDANLTSGAVTTVKNFLELIHIPAGWVNTSKTYRQVLRLVGWLFQFMQRLHVIYPHKLFDGQATLNTTYGELTPEWKDALLQCGQSFNFNTSGLTSQTTLRTILKYMAEQFDDMPLNTGLITL